MKCTNCSHEQASGKFCGKCGTPLQEADAVVVEKVVVSQPVNETAASVESATIVPSVQPTQPAQPNEQVELVKETSKKYIEYVKEFAVNPSRIFTKPENQFTNALITMAIVLLLASFTVYSASKEITSSVLDAIIKGIALLSGEELVGGFATEISSFFEPQLSKLSLFPTFGSAFIFLILLIGLSVLTTWGVMKISKQHLDFKQLIGVYGTFLIPVIGLVVISYLLILLNLLALGVGLLILALFLAVYLYPVRVVFHNFGGEMKIDFMHRGLMYFGGFSIALYVLISQQIKSKTAGISSVWDLLKSMLENSYLW